MTSLSSAAAGISAPAKGRDLTVTITSGRTLLAGLSKSDDAAARRLLSPSGGVVSFSVLVRCLFGLLKTRATAHNGDSSGTDDDPFLAASLDAVQSFSDALDALADIDFPSLENAAFDRSVRTLVAILDASSKWLGLARNSKRWSSLSKRTRQTLSRKYKAIFTDLFQGLGKYRMEIFALATPSDVDALRQLGRACNVETQSQVARFAAGVDDLDRREGRRQTLSQLEGLSALQSPQRGSVPTAAGARLPLESLLEPISVEFDADFFLGARFVKGTRDWVFSGIEEWRRNFEGARCRVLFAQAGWGKTALVAELLSRTPKDRLLAAHICQREDPARRNPRRIVKSIAYQIGQAMPEFRRILETERPLLDTILTATDVTIEELVDRLILKPLLRVSEVVPEEVDAARAGRSKPMGSGDADGRRLIVIDGIDEASHDMKNELIGCIQKHLAPHLPPHVCLLVTSRPEAFIKNAFASLNAVELDAASHQAQCDRDTRAFLRAVLEPHVPPERLDLSIDVAARKSEGNFLYLNWLRQRLDQLASHQRGKGSTGASMDSTDAFLDIYRLPNGLADAYLANLKHAFPSGLDTGPNGNAARRLIEVMVAAATPLHLAKELALLSGVNIRECRDVLDSLSSFFSVRDDGRVYVFHSSVIDWLVRLPPFDELSTGADEDYSVDVRIGHRRIAHACCGELTAVLDADTYRSDESASAALHMWCGALNTFSGSASSHEYALRWGVFHLTRAGEFETALCLLSSLSYLHARLAFGDWESMVQECSDLVTAAMKASTMDVVKEASLLLDAASLSRTSVRKGTCSLDEQYWQRLHQVGGGSMVQSLAADARARARAVGFMSAHQPFLQKAGGIARGMLLSPAGITSLTMFVENGVLRVAGASHDGVIRIWDAAVGGEPLLVLEGHTNNVGGLTSFTDTGGKMRLVSGSDDRSVRIWSTESSRALAVLDGHTDWVTSVVAIVADTSSGPRVYVASASWDKSIRVWDVDRQLILHTIVAHSKPINALAAFQGKDGKEQPLIISGSDDKTLCVVDPIRGDEPMKTLTGHTAPVKAVVCFEDGEVTKVASGSADKSVRLWVISLPGAAWQSAGVFVAHTMPIYDLSYFTVDGASYVVSGGWDHEILVWSLSGTVVSRMDGHTAEINAVEAKTFGGMVRVVSGGEDGGVRMWAPDLAFTLDENDGLSVAPDSSLPELDEDVRVTSIISFQSLSGAKLLICGHSDGFLSIWSLNDGAPNRVAVRRAHIGEVWALATFSTEEGTYVVTASSEDETVNVWSRDSNNPIFEGVGHENAVTCINCFGSLPPRIVSGSRDKTIRVWDPVSSKMELVLRGHSGWVTDVNLLTAEDDSYRIVSASEDRTVRIWRLSNPQALVVLEPNQSINAVTCFRSPSTGVPYVVSGGADGALLLWTPTVSEEKFGSLHGHSAAVVSLESFADPGTGVVRIVSAADDFTIRLWCPISFACLAVSALDTPVRDMCVSWGLMGQLFEHVEDEPAVVFFTAGNAVAALDTFLRDRTQQQEADDATASTPQRSGGPPSSQAGDDLFNTHFELVSPSRGTVRRRAAPATPHDELPLHVLVSCIKKELGLAVDAKLTDAVSEAAECLGIAHEFSPMTPTRMRVDRLAIELGIGVEKGAKNVAKTPTDLFGDHLSDRTSDAHTQQAQSDEEGMP